MSAEPASLSRLSALTVPTLPAGTPLLFESLADETIDFADLALALEPFPGIAGKLISLANSVWSAPATEICSLEMACARLGFGVVKSTSIALAIAAPFDPARCPAFDPERFWCSALLTADAAARLAQATGPQAGIEPATARAAGLLHGLGLLWLADRLPGPVDRAIAGAAVDPATSLRHALRAMLGFDQVNAAARLADAWRLPQPLASAMIHYRDAGYRGPRESIVWIVGLAHTQVKALLRDEPCPPPDARLAELSIDANRHAEVYRQLGAVTAKTRDLVARLI